jgi:uncharacterized protein DUF4236
MPFRFFRRIRIAPGVKLNVSKSGLSTSIGARGAHVTIGHGKVRTTVGLPGTGLSYTTSSSTGNMVPARKSRALFWLLVVIAIVFVDRLIAHL